MWLNVCTSSRCVVSSHRLKSNRWTWKIKSTWPISLKNRSSCWSDAARWWRLRRRSCAPSWNKPTAFAKWPNTSWWRSQRELTCSLHRYSLSYWILINPLSDWLTYWLSDWLIIWMIDWLIDWLLDWLTVGLINWSMHLSDWWTVELPYWLIIWSIDGWTDWLIEDWVIVD